MDRWYALFVLVMTTYIQGIHGVQLTTMTLDVDTLGSGLQAELLLTFGDYDNLDISCMIDLGDETVLNVLLDSYATNPSAGIITYDYPDYFNISAICLTETAMVTASVVNAYVGNVLTTPLLWYFDATNETYDVILPVEAPVTGNVVLLALMDSGTNVTIAAKSLLTDETWITEASAADDPPTSIVFPQSAFVNEGLYSMEITASNPLSPLPIVPAFIVFAVQQPIIVLSLANDLTDLEVEVDKEFVIDMALASGSQVIFSETLYDLNNLTLSVTGELCEGEVRTHSFPFTLSTTGIFYIEIEGSNFISSYRNVLKFNVVYAVNGLQSTVVNILSLYSDSVTFTIQILDTAGLLLPMGDVTCTVVYGDSATDEVTFSANVDAIGSLPKTSDSKVHSYVAGLYASGVYCANRIPTFVNFTYDMVIENPVEHIVLTTSHTRLGFTETLQLSVSLDLPSALPLDPLLCVFDYDDGNPSVEIDGAVTSLTNITTTYKFGRGDVDYAVTVTCSNYLTSLVLTKVIEVYWDCWVRPTFYFEDVFKPPSNPKTSFVNNPFELKATVALTNLCDEYPLVYTWSLLQTPDNGGTFNLYTSKDTDPGAYSIPANTVDDGLYMAELNVSFTGLFAAWITDYTYVEYSLPALKVILAGSPEQSVAHLTAENVVIDSSASEDPAGTLSSLASVPMVRQWECKTSTIDVITDDVVALYMSNPAIVPAAVSSSPDCPIPLTADAVTQSFLPQLYPVEQWFVFKLSLIRGSRTNIAIQAIKAVEAIPLNVAIRCVSNCHGGVTGVNKILQNDLQLNLDINEPGVVTTTATYQWAVMEVVGQTFNDLSSMVTDGLTKIGVRIPAAVFAPSGRYRVTCDVTLLDFAPSKAVQTYYVNLPPYNGDCTVSLTTGVASEDEFCVECSHWLDEGEYEERSAIDDSGASLVYDFLWVPLDASGQVDTVSGASTTLMSSSNNVKTCRYLKQPNLNITDQVQLEIRVKDKLLKPYAVWSTHVTVNPPFNADEITSSGGDAESAAIVQTAADKQKTKLEASLAAGDLDQVTSDAAVAASTLQDLVVPVPEPEISVEVKDDEGGLTDIREDGTAVSAEEAIADIHPPVVSPTTQVVQDTIKDYIGFVSQQVDKSIGSQAANPVMYSQAAGAINSILMNNQENVNGDTQINVATTLSTLADTFYESEIDTDSADTETAYNVLAGSVGSLIDSIVPAELADLQSPGDLVSARFMNTALFEIADTDTQALREDLLMTEDERNFFFMSNQRILKQKFADKKQQSELAAEAAGKVFDALYKKVRLCDSCTATISPPESGVTESLTRSPASELATKPVVSPTTSIIISGFADLWDEPHTVGVTELKRNIYMYDEDGMSSYVTSHIKKVKVSKQMTGPVTVVHKLEATTYTRHTPFIDPDDASQFDYFLVLVKRADDALCMVVKPAEDRIQHYMIYIAYDGDVTKINYVAKGSTTADNDWTVCFHPKQRPGRQIGVWRYGIESILKESQTGRRRKRAATTDTDLPQFDLAATTMACMTWDSENNKWYSDRCGTSWRADSAEMVCECFGTKELTFANSFYVPPNTIDFSSVFLKFSPLNQAAVIAALSVILILYILVILWARRQDKRDVIKWGVTPLCDNFSEDNYFYVLKVHTGLRPGAGTRSKICFVVGGDEMDSGVRELNDGVRKEFGTGSIMHFLLSTSVHMGALQYVRLWHDNSGGGNYASWYLSKIEIQDVQTNETFTFLAERWLAVDKMDGSVQCVLPVCGIENLNLFRNRFLGNCKDTLAESHIWISVAYRPVTSNFTRVQRSSCALVFIMLTMISNAMFFRSEENYETPALVTVGPFRFSLQQIYISLICALITTPATIAVIYLFKMSKRKPPKTNDQASKEPPVAKKYKLPFVKSWQKQQTESLALERRLLEKGYPRFDGYYLPHQFMYLAWVLVAVASFTSAFFVMLYSMQWGKQKTEEWLTTFCLSFFESVFCLDPIKIGTMALVFSCIFRSSKESSSVIDRGTIMRKYSSSLRARSRGIRLPAPPLDEDNLDAARQVREKELRMRAAVKNIIVNFILLWILFSISYSNRDSLSFYMHQHIVGDILSPEDSMKFTDIKSINEFYEWLNDTAIVNMFPELDPKGQLLHWRERQFITGGALFRVGPPRLRQLRTTEDTCHIPAFGTTDCYKKYSQTSEESGDYCIGWKSGSCDPNEAIYQYSSDAWKFTSAFDISGLPLTGYYTTYGGGGYIAKLAVNKDVSIRIVNELYNESWVDRQTRAVILEFTLYCLNSNIFTYNMFMVEFPETGGAIPFYMILPLRVYQHIGSLGVYTLACEVLFLVFLVISTVIVVIGIYQQKRKYFRKPWQVYDLVAMILGYVTCIMYIGRLVMTHQTLENFRNDKKEFVNFYHIAIWDQMFVLLTGLLVFMATLRFLSILGYNKRINAVARVFTNAADRLVWFGIFFVFVFTTYSVFGYLLFGSQLKSYKNIYSVMGTLFISMIGKSKFTEIEETDPVMSKLYFMIFIFFVVYLILTMFLAVLNQSIGQVNEEMRSDKGDEMVEYVLNKFKNLISVGGKSTRAVNPVPPAPWAETKASHVAYTDNKDILQDIRNSLSEALMLNKTELKTPEGDKIANVKFRR